MKAFVRRNAVFIGVVISGLALTVLAVRSLGAPAGDVLVLLTLAGSASLAAGGLGVVVLRTLRRKSLRTQIVAVAGVALLTTTSGVVVAAVGMFISSHDLKAMFVVLAISVSVALGGAVQVGRQIGEGAQGVRDLARHLASGIGADAAELPPLRSAPELQQVADEVADLPRRLEELRQRAEALDRSRRELVAWVSHDLRSPLATIRAMAEALDDRMVTDADTVARYHHQLRRDAERLSALVDDLFELSRINSGSLDLHSERIDLRSIVTESVSSITHRAESKGVLLRAEVAAGLEVDTPVAELSRVLRNLIDNAVRHTPEGGTVEVRARTDGDVVHLTVSDECGGIPEPDLDRVFDVAFRGDAARTRDHQGGGLGLTIAKGLVEACDGDIAVSNADRGCEFTVRLPRVS
ncbi:MAG: HAMP domain-containing histidine kinase [Acidimicrobiales bacterium]|nr:HAMP domain-containing histidine kinase [Acidimicrobiales bacterium]